MDGKSFSESPFNVDYSEGFVLGPNLCLLCINGFSDDVFCITAISAMIFFFSLFRLIFSFVAAACFSFWI